MNSHSIFFFALFTLLLSVEIEAQQLYRINSIWQGDFNEWELETDSSGLYAYFKNARPFSEKATFWRFDMGEMDGTIQLRDEQRNLWELESRNRRITFYPVYRNDLRTWRFSDDDVQLIFESRWSQRFDEWLFESNKDTFFYMYTDIENDPSDWHIEDKLTSEFSHELRLALAFCCIYNTIPKKRK
jgi:hypothetical protein